MDSDRPPRKVFTRTATKSQVRAAMRLALAALPAESLEAGSREIGRQLLAHPFFNSPRTVALFAPLPGEPDLTGLLDCESTGHRFCFPRVTGDALVFGQVPDLSTLRPGFRGILEPGEEAAPIPLAALEVVIVPGIAFTRNGERLGRGGGFYDRLLASDGFAARTIGVCFAPQILPTIPTEEHDRRVDAVVFA